MKKFLINGVVVSVLSPMTGANYLSIARHVEAFFSRHAEAMEKPMPERIEIAPSEITVYSAGGATRLVVRAKTPITEYRKFPAFINLSLSKLCASKPVVEHA